MLLCTVVPKVTATLFLMLPLNFADKLPDYRPTLPMPPEPTRAPEGAMMGHFRKELLRIEARLQQFEHEPDRHGSKVTELLGLYEILRLEISRLERPTPAPRMPTVTGNDLRELRGLPPLPPKVRD